MPGKEDKDAVFVLGLGFQIVAQDAQDVLLRGLTVEEHDDLVEAKFPQDVPNRPSVVHGVFELRPFLVCIDANDHSPALAIPSLKLRGLGGPAGTRDGGRGIAAHRRALLRPWSRLRVEVWGFHPAASVPN